MKKSVAIGLSAALFAISVSVSNAYAIREGDMATNIITSPASVAPQEMPAAGAIAPTEEQKGSRWISALNPLRLFRKKPAPTQEMMEPQMSQPSQRGMMEHPQQEMSSQSQRKTAQQPQQEMSQQPQQESGTSSVDPAEQKTDPISE